MYIFNGHRLLGAVRVLFSETIQMCDRLHLYGGRGLCAKMEFALKIAIKDSDKSSHRLTFFLI